MKAIMIAYNQAYNEEIIEVLENNGQRGYTRWDEVLGRGSFDGEPHLGSHAWPVKNITVLSVVEEDKVQGILYDLKRKNEESPELGIRAFVWSVEDAIL